MESQASKSPSLIVSRSLQKGYLRGRTIMLRNTSLGPNWALAVSHTPDTWQTESFISEQQGWQTPTTVWGLYKLWFWFQNVAIESKKSHGWVWGFNNANPTSDEKEQNREWSRGNRKRLLNPTGAVILIQTRMMAVSPEDRMPVWYIW